MKIVVIGGYAPSLVLFRAPLLRLLVAHGHEVTAMASGGTPAIRRQLSALGVTYQELMLARAGLDPLHDAKTLASLVLRLRVLAPDLMFAYTMKPVIYGNLAARIVGVPRRYSMITGLGYAFSGQEHRRRRLLRLVISGLLRVALHASAGLFVQNPDDLAELRDEHALPRGLRVTIVRGSGVDIDHYAMCSLPTSSSPIQFVYVGRLLVEKGIGEFATMASRVRASHPGVRFVVAGSLDPNPSSVHRDELAEWVERGTLEYVGEVGDVRVLLAASHVLVLPSYREGTPRVVLEAMSMGRPVIVTDVPGCRETIVHGEHGLLVPPRDAEALVAAARRLMADHSQIVAMGQRARVRIEQLYDARDVAAHMVRVMEYSSPQPSREAHS